MIMCSRFAVEAAGTHRDSVQTFYVSPETKGSYTVWLQNAQKRTSCTFEFDTTSEMKKVETKKDWLSPEATIENAIKPLKNSKKCVQRIAGQWTYKICFGEIVTQSEPGSLFELGTYVGYEKTTLPNGKSVVVQSYKQGTLCNEQFPRSSAVQFTCGSAVEIANIEEPSICQYRFTVTLPEVCGHPDFEGITVRGPGKEQAWFLEIDELLDTATSSKIPVCSVQHSGYHNIDPMYFSSFILAFDQDTTMHAYNARRPNRVPIDAAEIEVHVNGIATQKRNPLQYASISAK